MGWLMLSALYIVSLLILSSYKQSMVDLETKELMERGIVLFSND